MRTHALTIAVAALLESFWSDSGETADEAHVGIIQYNVKGGQGGWTKAGGVLDTQVHLIANKIKVSPVDFVALEQAGEIPGAPGPLISSELAKNGMDGWNTIVSSCNKDATQLAFSPNWELVPQTSNVNPLQNGTFPQRGWRIGGCEPHGDGRPYNIAYLRNKVTKLKLLIIVTHMPHCHERPDICVAGWNRDQFIEDVRKAISAGDRSNANLIVVGDMNELGRLGNTSVFAPLFPDSGKLQISNSLPTCCSDSNWAYSFDRIVTNAHNAPSAEILNDGVYPINPAFRGHEEHKAIYAKVTF
jgi:hypothetical protein